jgi:uncharacterized protein
MADQTFAVRYEYVPDMESRRDPHRADHLAFLRAAADAGWMVLAGALTDPVDTGWLVVRAESTRGAYERVLDDPYARAGLIRSVTVRPIALAIPAS